MRRLARHLGLTLAVALALGAPLRASERPVADQRLEALGNRYFAEAFRLDPSRATGSGLHDYDGLLGDYSEAGYRARIALAKKYLAELNAIDAPSLGAEGSYDAQILRSRLESTLLSLGTLETWRHNPSSYSGIAAGAVYGLLTRDFAPLPVRMRSIIARERAMPALLAQGAANTTTVDAVTADLARRNLDGTLAFFSTVVPPALKIVRDARLQADFARANEAVLAALRQYRETMNAGPLGHPSGTYAIGPQIFQRMLQLQELAPLTLAEYERVGNAALNETKAQFIATAKQIDPSKSPQEVQTELGAVHPPAGALLKTATADLLELRRFVVAHHIVTLPTDNDVRVVPTPEFARQTSFASMNSPGPLETRASEAYYNVTPVEPDWSAERQAQHLTFFNNFTFPLISAHEVMPGHYVNFAIARHLKLSQIRRLISSSSFAEGWAHYDEQMMVDEGWGGGDPRVRLAQLGMALQREARYLVGLREHTAGMTVAEGTRFFEDNAFMTEETSRREALRGTQDPLYGYYTLGKLELLKLREDYRAKMGAKFTLQDFHDELLAHGDPPMAIVRKILLGASDDGKLL